MSLQILNNTAALYAQNNLNTTQSSLQNTLQQLSSGSRINSGADDAAGLAVADGLHANAAALNQSVQNANSGIGLLQTADGALSQVTNLLDRAVTLATESANGTLTSAQVSSANQEYQNILTQIGNIGSTTNFNSTNVFSSSATNFVVTDGTSSGLNTYADTIGALNTGSVGTTAGSAVVATTLAPVTTQAVNAVAKVAGKYTFTPVKSTDNLSGQLSFTVGSGTAINVTVAANTSTSALQTQLMATSAFTAAGLSASITASTGALVITGPTSGTTAAANTVSFTGTGLTETRATPAMTGATVPVSAGTAATGSLGVSGAANADTFSGTIILTQGSTSKTITIAANSVSGLATTSGTVQFQIAAQIGSNFSVGTAGGTADNPIFNFVGAKNATAGGVTVTGTFADSTTSNVAVIAPGTGVAGTAPVPSVGYSLSALSTATDTFGVGSTLTIGSAPITLDNLTGSAAATAITTAIAGDATLSTLGLTVAFDATSKVLTISGKSDGSALPVITGASTLSDISSVAPVTVSTVGSTTAASGNSAVTAANTVITLGGATDTLGGSLNIVVGTGSTAKTAALTVKAGTSGATLALQIGQNASFLAAGITAAFDSTANALTLTGPAGLTNTFAVTGTLTDSTTSVPGAGANFSSGGVSQLTHDSAATILTTVTAAIADVAFQRGTIGAYVNQLNSAANVTNSEQVNLTSTENSIRATNYGQAASDLAKYQILSQTGISALAQANSVQQEVLKLLQ